MNEKYGQGIVGALLRMQRGETPLREIAQATKYRNPNMVSYIELGYSGIPASRVELFARAYRLDVEEFGLFWSVMRLIDEHAPKAVISDFIAHATLWGDGDAGPDGSPGGNPRRKGGPVVDAALRRGRTSLRLIATRALEQIHPEFSEEPGEDQGNGGELEAALSSHKKRLLIRSSVSTLTHRICAEWRNFFCLDVTILLSEA